MAGDDLGQAFFGRLQQGIVCRGETMRLIDFDTAEENDWSVVTELPCQVDQSTASGSFRPDITVFVNGLPLAFCEVKIPNNLKGMQAEYERMNKRTNNGKYRRFLNITQLMSMTIQRLRQFLAHFMQQTDVDIYSSVIFVRRINLSMMV